MNKYLSTVALGMSVAVALSLGVSVSASAHTVRAAEPAPLPTPVQTSPAPTSMPTPTATPTYSAVPTPAPVPPSAPAPAPSQAPTLPPALSPTPETSPDMTDDDRDLPPELQGDGAGSTLRQIVDPGFRTFSSGSGNVLQIRSRYTIKLRPGVEYLRQSAQQAAASIGSINGVGISVAPGTFADPKPGFGEILVGGPEVISNPCSGRARVLACAGPVGLTALPSLGVTLIDGGHIDFTARGRDQNAAARTATFKHELGHVLGLDHFDGAYAGSTQLMNSTSVQSDYRAGDISGLVFLRSKVATTSLMPIGNYDSAVANAGAVTKVTIAGWAADPSDKKGVTVVHTSVQYPDGNSKSRDVMASVDRPDVGSHFPAYGRKHGFIADYEVSQPGTYTICAEVDSVARVGATGLGCKTVKVAALTAPTPIISGKADVGQVLTATVGTWGPKPVTTSLQWYADGVAIAGATTTGYTLTWLDAGKSVTFGVTGSKDGHLKTTKTSAPTSIVGVPGLTFSRISGTDRYSTAVEASKAAFSDSAAGAPVVWIASGENFPDALSAGPAAANQNGPLLLTRSGELPAATLTEIQRLHPARIVLVGGTTSVTTSVEAKLKKVAPTTRIAGANRYEISRKIVAYAFGTTATRGSKTAVYMATGADFPDAVSGGAAAAAKGVPLLLVDGRATSADAATITSLNTLGVSELTVIGGTASMSTSIKKSLAAIAPVTSTAGSDRFEIAHELNILAYGKVDTVYITTGRTFPDALAGIPLAAKKKGPLFLVPGDCIPSNLLASIQSLGIKKMVIIGGPASVSEAVTRPTACR